jgi:hypothetical protein
MRNLLVSLDQKRVDKKRALDPVEVEQSISPLVRKICKTLEAERVAYCHWKSNKARKPNRIIRFLIEREKMILPEAFGNTTGKRAEA